MFKVLYFPSVMVWSLPFPPSKIQPGYLLYRTSCPSPLSFRPSCLLSARFCVFSRPPPASGHPSSVRWKATNPPAKRSTNVLSWFPVQRSICRFAPPPQPVRLVVLGLGVGGGLKETAPPAMVLSPSTRWQASPGLACLRQRSLCVQHTTLFRSTVCCTPPVGDYATQR